MSDKVDKIIEALGEDGVQELLERLTKAKQQKPVSKDGIVRLDSPKESTQPTQPPRTNRVFRPVNTEARENKFLSMPEYRMYQDVTEKVDKKIRKTTSERRESQRYAIHCSKCGQEYILNSLAHVHKDSETGEYVYTCNNCIPHPR